jgi:hypothetical protein
MTARMVALALAEYLDRAALAATTVSTAIGLPSFTPLALAALQGHLGALADTAALILGLRCQNVQAVTALSK